MRRHGGVRVYVWRGSGCRGSRHGLVGGILGGCLGGSLGRLWWQQVVHGGDGGWIAGSGGSPGDRCSRWRGACGSRGWGLDAWRLAVGSEAFLGLAIYTWLTAVCVMVATLHFRILIDLGKAFRGLVSFRVCWSLTSVWVLGTYKD